MKYLFFINYVYVCVCVGICAWCAHGGQRSLGAGVAGSSEVPHVGIKLRSSRKAGYALNH